MQENGFRLIAIQPLNDCHIKLLKNLLPGKQYFFYQNCNISETEELIINEDFLSADFFSSDGPVIEINAIVGKNGSGKSTVVELFLMAINNLAYRYERFKAQIAPVEGLHVVVYFQLGTRFHKLNVRDMDAELLVFNTRRKHMIKDKRTSLRSLFYTIAVNYSHYAYNERDYLKNQNWLPGVFHKNDGYQIPIVLNPFRELGNIDMNLERPLVNARLIANLLRPSSNNKFDYRRITDDLRAVRLKLGKRIISPKKVIGTINGEEIPLESINFDEVFLNKCISTVFKIPLKTLILKENTRARKYIYYKLVSMSLKYEAYNKYFDYSTKQLNNNFLSEYLLSLDFDPSHIAFKFKQAINFIRFGHIDHDAKILELDSFGKTVYDLMSEKNKRNIKELIELLPPPIFSTQIQMTNNDTGAVVTLGELSSGEKQWNYCVSTVLYHLNNLDSIRRSNHGLNYYNRVLIVLEEIELYFHPEMQKRFVQHIIESIRQLKLHNIEHIQIIMVTHSPFVLSDIPSKNILFLNKGGAILADDIGLTFGGNIHELLAKGFFLNDGLVGEYAQYKINTIIKRLQKESDPVQTEEYIELLKTISLIGEDFLREKLIEMLNRKTIPVTRKEEIKLLEDRLKMLKRQQDND